MVLAEEGDLRCFQGALITANSGGAKRARLDSIFFGFTESALKSCGVGKDLSGTTPWVRRRGLERESAFKGREGSHRSPGDRVIRKDTDAKKVSGREGKKGVSSLEAKISYTRRVLNHFQ